MKSAAAPITSLDITVRQRFGGPQNTEVLRYSVSGQAAMDAGVVNGSRTVMIGRNVASQTNTAWERPATIEPFNALLEAVHGSGLLQLPHRPATSLLPADSARIVVDDRVWIAPLAKLPAEFRTVMEALDTYVHGLTEAPAPPAYRPITPPTD